MAYRAIRNGDGEIYLAGGVESMSRAPYSLPKAEQGFVFGNQTAYDTAAGLALPQSAHERTVWNRSHGRNSREYR